MFEPLKEGKRGGTVVVQPGAAPASGREEQVLFVLDGRGGEKKDGLWLTRSVKCPWPNREIEGEQVPVIETRTLLRQKKKVPRKVVNTADGKSGLDEGRTHTLPRPPDMEGTREKKVVVFAHHRALGMNRDSEYAEKERRC